MPEYKPGSKFKAPKEKPSPSAPKGKPLFLSLTPLLPFLGSFSVLLPVFETPIDWNEKGESVGVGLRFLWEFLSTQTLPNQIFQGIVFPLLALLGLALSTLACTSSFFPLEQEGKADKRYVLSMAGDAFCFALLGLFGLTFNHLVLMGAGLGIALLCFLFLFLHYKKLTSY